MSLINDALKRANEAQRQQSARLQQTLRLQPADSSRRPGALPAMLIPVLVILLTGVATWFLWNWWAERSQASVAHVSAPPTNTPAPPPPVTATQAVSVVASNPATVVVTPPTNAVTVAVTPTNAPPPVNPPAPVPVSPPATTTVVMVTPPVPPPPKVEFPKLQLQGIFYRADNPSALINGRTLFVGHYVSDVKVIAIEPRSVTVEFEGVTKTLHLQ